MDEKRKSSIEAFYNSLEKNEQDLLSNYIKFQRYENLSEKFDSLLEQENETN